MIRFGLVALVAALGLSAPAAAAEILSQKRTATVYAYTYDYIWNDGQVEDSDAASTTGTGIFSPSLSAQAYFPFGGYGTADQWSVVDKDALLIGGYGLATGGVYVQATGAPATRGEGTTTMEATFKLNKAGTLDFYAGLGAWNPGQGDNAPTAAYVLLKNVDTNEVVYVSAVGIQDYSEIDEVIDLPAGTYKLIVGAQVRATSGAGGEVYAEGAACFDVSAQVTENP